MIFSVPLDARPENQVLTVIFCVDFEFAVQNCGFRRPEAKVSKKSTSKFRTPFFLESRYLTWNFPIPLFWPVTGVELGAGLGLPSIVASNLGAKMIATDGDDALTGPWHHEFQIFFEKFRKFWNFWKIVDKIRKFSEIFQNVHSLSTTFQHFLKFSIFFLQFFKF